MGTKVYEELSNVPTGEVTIPMNLTQLQPGVYLVKLMSGGTALTRKVVIKKD